jgi:glycosyltransferase involved in cell wall biosynthesis
LARNHAVTLVILHWAASAATEFAGSGDFAGIHLVPYSSCRFATDPSYDVAAPVRDRLRRAMSSSTPDVVLRHWSPVLVDLLAALDPRRFDVVWAARGYFAEQALAAGYENVIVDLPDIESEVHARFIDHDVTWLARPPRLLELARIRAWERDLASRVSGVVVCKQSDVDAFGSEAKNIHLVRNGVSPVTAPRRCRERSDEILFVGTLNYPPNVDAVRVFHDEVLPRIRVSRPSMRFVIAGKNPHRDVWALHDGGGSIVLADVADLAPIYERAAVVIVPMRLGSGTRIKAMEAMAHGKALVSTAVGVEGIDVRPGVDYLRAELPEQFAEACLRLLRNRALRDRLGESGRARIRDRYQWEGAIEGAEHVLRSTVGRQSRGVRRGTDMGADS